MTQAVAVKFVGKFAKRAIAIIGALDSGCTFRLRTLDYSGRRTAQPDTEAVEIERNRLYIELDYPRSSADAGLASAADGR